MTIVVKNARMGLQQVEGGGVMRRFAWVIVLLFGAAAVLMIFIADLLVPLGVAVGNTQYVIDGKLLSAAAALIFILAYIIAQIL